MLKFLLRTTVSLEMRNLNNKLQFKESIDLYHKNIDFTFIDAEKEEMNLQYIYASQFQKLENIVPNQVDLNVPLYVKETKERVFLKKLILFIRGLTHGAFVLLIYLVFLKSNFQFKNGLVDYKSHIRVSESSDIRFSDVKGIDECREELEEIVDYLKNPEKFKKAGAKSHKGLLLTGAPGTGKTLLAKAIAGEAGVNFFYNSGSDFDEMFIGLGASRIRKLFKKAKKQAPCIIFIDEIDALASSRKGMDSTSRQALNQLLVEIDGFTPSDSVIVIAATNLPEVIDNALKRSGRFDKEVHVPLPNLKGRKEILDLYLTKIQYDNDMDTEFIARKTIGMTGAAIANIVNLAAVNAAKYNKPFCDASDFDYAIDRVMLGISRNTYSMTDEEIYNTSYHELGHAFMAFYTGFSEIHKITILPRGHTLGHTAYLPRKEHGIWTKEELLSALDTAVGGRAAEEIFRGNLKITTGCSSDLAKATEFVYSGIRSGLFSNELGFACYDSIDGLGEKQRNAIDALASKLLMESYGRVKYRLEKNRSLLEYLAKELKKRETLTRDEFLELINRYSSYNMSDKTGLYKYVYILKCIMLKN